MQRPVILALAIAWQGAAALTPTDSADCDAASCPTDVKASSMLQSKIAAVHGQAMLLEDHVQTEAAEPQPRAVAVAVDEAAAFSDEPGSSEGSDELAAEESDPDTSAMLRELALSKEENAKLRAQLRELKMVQAGFSVGEPLELNEEVASKGEPTMAELNRQIAELKAETAALKKMLQDIEAKQANGGGGAGNGGGGSGNGGGGSGNGGGAAGNGGGAGDETPAPARDATTLEQMEEMLDLHNKMRCNHAVPLLDWSEDLAKKAQEWAETAGSMRHSSSDFRRYKGEASGENIAWGMPSFSGVKSTQAWYDEIKLTPGGTGKVTGFSGGTGHYTQVVWKDTKKVGCGHSKMNRGDFWVCIYWPAGNFMGRFQQNVFEKTVPDGECANSDSKNVGDGASPSGDADDGEVKEEGEGNAAGIAEDGNAISGCNAAVAKEMVIAADSTSSGWAWDVKRLKFLKPASLLLAQQADDSSNSGKKSSGCPYCRRRGSGYGCRGCRGGSGLPPGWGAAAADPREISLGGGCQAIDSGNAGAYYGADNAFKDGGCRQKVWGGRKTDDATAPGKFYVGLRCNTAQTINEITLDQPSNSHFASNVRVLTRNGAGEWKVLKQYAADGTGPKNVWKCEDPSPAANEAAGGGGNGGSAGAGAGGNAEPYTSAGKTGVANEGGEKWLNGVLPKGSGVKACYEAVMAEPQCAKDYFSYVARGDKNCGCNKRQGSRTRGDGRSDIYKITAR